MSYYCKTINILELVKSLPRSHVRMSDLDHIVISDAMDLAHGSKGFVIAACADLAGGLMNELTVPINGSVSLPHDLILRL